MTKLHPVLVKLFDLMYKHLKYGALVLIMVLTVIVSLFLRHVYHLYPFIQSFNWIN